MHRRRLFWQIFPAMLFVTLAAVAGATVFGGRMMRQFHERRMQEDLLARAQLIAPDVLELLAANDPAGIDMLAKRLGHDAHTRITVLLPDGRVLGDTDEDPSRMENHASRDEIVAAASHGIGHSIRTSRTIGQPMLYVATTLGEPGTPRGYLRMSIPMTEFDEHMRSLYTRLAIMGGLIALLAAMLSLMISRRLAQPLEALRQAADRFARGETDARLPQTHTEEVSGLATAMKQMAQQLNERIRAEATQRNQQQAVLASMAEGVIAVDAQERVVSVNLAARRMVGVDGPQAAGRPIQEVIRNTDLLRFIQRALLANEPIESDIVIHGEQQRFLRATGTVLRDGEGKAIGGVVVLHDMTRLRHLEQLRREFVANVSHELRTPITSIKGFAETMLENTGGDPAESEKFLRIIARQADRLNAIIEDLLALARIEQDADHGEIARSKGAVREILMGAIQICAHGADEKGVRLHLECEDQLTAQVNAPLIEQAVVNLIDNAIKYSEPGTVVEIGVERGDAEIQIRVTDHGAGIEQRHHARLFERFYRVDKARSRKAGGTGLGLAIVKHIAEAHGGRISVQSAPGQGSTFTLSLPRSA